MSYCNMNVCTKTAASSDGKTTNRNFGTVKCTTPTASDFNTFMFLEQIYMTSN